VSISKTCVWSFREPLRFVLGLGLLERFDVSGALSYF
jgi:hypothetical protein